jgi:hypothetical protein
MTYERALDCGVAYLIVAPIPPAARSYGNKPIRKTPAIKKLEARVLTAD